jgi:hypothetical protein
MMLTIYDILSAVKKSESFSLSFVDVQLIISLSPFPPKQ